MKSTVKHLFWGLVARFITFTYILTLNLYKSNGNALRNSVGRLKVTHKFSFTNIRGPFSNYVGCESFLESNSPDILVLCKTNLDDSIDSGNFSVRGYLPLIQKDSVTHIRVLAVYVKEGLPFARDFSPENSQDSYLCFRLAFLHSVYYFFFLYRSPSSSLHTTFDVISSNRVEVLSINPSGNLFVFGNVNFHHKDWPTYYGGTDRPGKLCYNDLTSSVK